MKRIKNNKWNRLFHKNIVKNVKRKQIFILLSVLKAKIF